MLRKWLNRTLWRRLRLRVWHKRLLSELASTCQRVPLNMEVRLRLSWGPFYNGAAMLDFNLKTATILIQIPCDSFVTENELEVLERFQLPVRQLPYFMLNHEYFHLIDSVSQLREENGRALLQKIAGYQKQARLSNDYRSLLNERLADEFAYHCYREKMGKAC